MVLDSPERADSMSSRHHDSAVVWAIVSPCQLFDISALCEFYVKRMISYAIDVHDVSKYLGTTVDDSGNLTVLDDAKFLQLGTELDSKTL
jgi:hypothetical protein